MTIENESVFSNNYLSKAPIQNLTFFQCGNSHYQVFVSLKCLNEKRFNSDTDDVNALFNKLFIKK